MFKGYLTQTDLVKLNLSLGSINLNSNRLANLINSYITSEQYTSAIKANNYYKGKHDILNKRRYYHIDGKQIEDTTKANNKLIHNFYETLVTQKANYIAGNPIKLKLLNNNNELLNKISKLLSDKFDDLILQVIIDASNRGTTYIHPYINENGEFKLTNISSTEIIPIYDSDYENELLEVIRFYPIEYINETNYSSSLRYKVEWWTKEEVYTYIELSNGMFVLDQSVENPAPHFKRLNYINNNITNMSWGVVPFIPVYNNAHKGSDLTPDIETLINSYNRIKSGWCDDIDDFQEMIYVLKGYIGLGGDKNITRLSNFFHNLKMNKAISVDEQGGVEVLKSEIPFEAKERLLKLTREEIFFLGKGIDIMSEKLGGNQSGVSLKFIYSHIDLKANALIRYLTSALNKLMYYVSLYMDIKENIKFDYNDVYFVFNKSMLFNESEIIHSLVQSKDLISDKTIIENHPYVNDIEIELQRVEEQKANELNNTMKLYNG